MSSSFFSNNDFMPHGMRYLWQQDILWTSVISDVLTALAYFSITAAVIVFVKKRKDLPYPEFFLLAGSVIFLACGTSHLVSAIVIWFVLPFFLQLPSPSMLEKKNRALQNSLNKLNIAQTSLIESEKMAAIGGLVAGLAHEINTPLGVSITAASSLVESTDELSKHFMSNQVSRKELSQYLEGAKLSA